MPRKAAVGHASGDKMEMLLLCEKMSQYASEMLGNSGYQQRLPGFPAWFSCMDKVNPELDPVKACGETPTVRGSFQG